MVTNPDGLRLHEAMVVAMIRRRAPVGTDQELAAWNQNLALYRQKNGDWPDADQIRLRATEYPMLFTVEETGQEALIWLRVDLSKPGDWGRE